MSMDKEIARRIMQQCGIRVAPLVHHAPCIVKPVRGGSSIGVQVCDTDAQLEAIDCPMKAQMQVDLALEEAFVILIEHRIIGREISVAVLGEKALMPIELIPPKGHILDYTAKYTDGEEGKKIECPARISAELTKELQEAAEKLHKAMKLSVYSRTDFLVDAQGIAWCLEINTLPGMTEYSCFPREAACDGIDYSSLCEMIIRLSLDKNSKTGRRDACR